MQEQKERKAEELRKKKAEEDRLEAKLARERQELEERFKDEMDQKKKKVNDIREANAQMANEKQSRKQVDVIQEDGIQIMMPKKSAAN